MNQTEHVIHPFQPLYRPDSEILILGSLPSLKSREQMFFYGHPRNRFWPLLALLFDEPVPETVEEKRALALRHHIALWDTVFSCDITGSSDSSIRNVVPTDLRPVLAQSRIRKIFCNGSSSASFFRKYHAPLLGRDAVPLPSTSPANAAWTMECLYEAWRCVPEACMPRPYYQAYEDRYRTVHALGLQWSGTEPTPIVADVLSRYCPDPKAHILEIGCGEGRDAAVLLEQGRNLRATDASPEAVAYCRQRMPLHTERFSVLDCLRDVHEETYDLIYSVAVLHMLVSDDDRRGFYRFLAEHLKENGIALICCMGDGTTAMRSDISQAFELQERDHPAGRLRVAATSCRMVPFPEFRKELVEAGLRILEDGITSSPPDFDRLMYAVVCPG